MNQSTYDPYLLYSTQPFGIIGIQTDDTLILRDPDFLNKEELELRKANFLAKDYEQLTATTDHKFNSGIIYLQDDGSIALT